MSMGKRAQKKHDEVTMAARDYCRYCSNPVGPELERPVCRRCLDEHDRHRTEAGVASCEACGRRETVRYRCTGCEEKFDVPGTYRWHWQGHGHFLDEDDPGWWGTVVGDHYRSHDGTSVILPDRPRSGVSARTDPACEPDHTTR